MLVHSNSEQEPQNSKPLTTNGIFYLGKYHNLNIVMTKISSLYTTSSHAIAQTVTGFSSEALVQSWDSPSGTRGGLSTILVMSLVKVTK
jgi:hypothetical protein